MSHQMTDMAAYISLFNLCLGAGMLATPSAVFQAGWVWGIIAILITGAIVSISLQWLIQCAQIVDKSRSIQFSDSEDEVGRAKVTYERVAEAAYGQLGSNAIKIGMFCAQMGFCVAFISYVSSSMHHEFRSFSEESWVFLVTPIFIGISNIRSLKYLTIPTMISIVVLASCIIVMILECFFDYKFYSPKEINMFTASPSLHGISSTVSTIAYAFNWVGLLLHVRDKMTNPTHLPKVLYAGLISGLFVYISFSTLMILCFGYDIQSVLTNNFKLNMIMKIVNVSLCLTMINGFAQCMFPVSKIIDSLCDNCYSIDKRSSITHNFIRVNTRIIQVCLCSLMVLLVPNFKFIVDISGCLFSGFLCVLAPCLCHMKLAYGLDKTESDNSGYSLLDGNDHDNENINKNNTGFRFYFLPVFFLVVFSCAICTIMYYTLSEV